MNLQARPLSSNAASGALSALTLTGLEAALDRGSAPRHITTDGGDDLLACLAQQDDLSHRARTGANTLNRTFLISEPRTLTLAQTRWASAQFPGGAVSARVAGLRDRLSALLRRPRVQGDPVAPRLLDVIAREAWQDTEFRRALAATIRDHLRSRVILHPEGDAVPSLARASLWTLAAMGAQRCTSDLPKRRGRLLQDRLGARATQARQAKRWAGFWDAYLDHAGRETGIAMPAPELPFDLTTKTDSPPQMRAAWRNEAPGFATYLAQGAL